MALFSTEFQSHSCGFLWIPVTFLWIPVDSGHSCRNVWGSEKYCPSPSLATPSILMVCVLVVWLCRGGGGGGSGDGVGGRGGVGDDGCCCCFGVTVVVLAIVVLYNL